MGPSFRFDAAGESSFQVLWQDGERIVCRRSSRDADGHRRIVLTVRPAAEHPTPASLDRV